MTDHKSYWQINTERLARDIKQAARRAITEEDLKMAVEPLLQHVFRQMGVDIDIVQYEKSATRFKGKADAVYGYITLEYKVPGKLSGRIYAANVGEQLRRYLTEQATAAGAGMENFLEKALGVVGGK